MDNNITKALWLGIGVLFFVGVVSLAIGVFKDGGNLIDKQNENITKVRESMTEAEYAQFDNTSVNGGDVISCIKRYREKAETFAVSVQTKKSTHIYLNNASFSGTKVTLGAAHSQLEIEAEVEEARKETSQAYINYNAKFSAKLRRDENDVISGVIFKQE